VDSMNRLARAAARQALALDSTIAEAYVAEGNALYGDMRLADAVRAFEKARAVDSINVDVLWAYGAMLLAVGRVQDGLIQLRRARELDPLTPTIAGLLAYGLEMDRQYD